MFTGAIPKPAIPSPRPSPRQSTSSAWSSVSDTSSRGSRIETRQPPLRRKPSAGILTTTTTASGVRTTRLTATSHTAAATSTSTANPITITTTNTSRTGTGTGTATARLRPAISSPRSPVTPISGTARSALRPRDQNVAPSHQGLKPRLPPEQYPSIMARMPTSSGYDKASAAAATTSTTARQPQMPSVARGINKPPLTPRIAARASTPQPNPQLLHQNAPFVTPLPRRAPRPESVLSGNSTSNSTSINVPAREREDLTSPVSSFLNTNNITPRSGTRQSRVDSANSTPNGTPNLERGESWEARSGLGISGSGADDMARRPKVVTFNPPPEATVGTRPDADSKFFYAFDAQKPAQQAAPAKPTAQLQKSATFFYANGSTVPLRDNPPPASFTPVLAATPTPDTPPSKFVYANAIPDLVPPPRSGANSVVSMPTRLPASRPASLISPAPHASQRPISPVKLSPYLQTKTGNTPTIAAQRPPPSTANSAPVPANQRRLNTEATPRAATRPAHTRTPSLTMADPPAVARVISAHSSLPSSEDSSPLQPSPPSFSPIPNHPATNGIASLLQAADDLPEDDETPSPDLLGSPSKPSTQDAQLNELVASARRERKVQDLQITNASLEAINRTLERQLRKQTNEIRRFKRLSRSGRLSLNSMGSRVASDSTVDGGALARAGMGLDDLSEEESEMEAEEDEFDDEDSMSGSADSTQLSPNAIATRDARHRLKDEQRLQLDLTKHQQLLIDSQMINQSLKRCLGWTEELIKEGKRALEYRVQVSEVELGGRVLAPEDIEAREAGINVDDIDDADDADDLYGYHGEDSTLHGMEEGEEARLASSPSAQQAWGDDAQDRDSGVELPREGG
ncbi:hypothetical protein B0T19DRAFT_434037 [Cercophora scortea]|uniref:Uncharacterized protein n=1 Tax=Cercophora scortea TaxID=314031 RepID=A0AAE0I821_9PEZI|nr:hypothetical protein B0T19DRAFT_434037 [Cercophora scortea]